MEYKPNIYLASGGGGGGGGVYATSDPCKIVRSAPLGNAGYTWGPSKLSLDFDDIFQEMLKRFSKAPITEHKCHNCGATLEMKSDEYIFKCPYCKSVYAVGTAQIHSRY